MSDFAIDGLLAGAGMAGSMRAYLQFNEAGSVSDADCLSHIREILAQYDAEIATSRELNCPPRKTADSAHVAEHKNDTTVTLRSPVPSHPDWCVCGHLDCQGDTVRAVVTPEGVTAFIPPM